MITKLKKNLTARHPGDSFKRGDAVVPFKLKWDPRERCTIVRIGGDFADIAYLSNGDIGPVSRLVEWGI